MGLTASYKRITDAQLIRELNCLLQHERKSTVAFIRALEEFDRRRLYLGLGFCSLYGYCRERLHFSEDAAYTRIVVARASRRCPRLLDMVQDGRLSLTTACMVAKHLSSDRAEELLRRSVFKSRRELEVILATLYPKPPVSSTIRKVPDVKPAALAAATTAMNIESLPEQAALSTLLTGPPLEQVSLARPPAQAAALSSPRDYGPASMPSASRPIVTPLSALHYKLQVTISTSAHDRLRNIQDLMRHANPTGDAAVIVERALEVLEADLLKKKAADVAKPRATQLRAGGPKGRHIPASVMRAVWRRDQAQCAFVGAGGKKCGSTSGVEFHHVRPFAVGGGATVENIALRCRAHNTFEWERHLDEETATLVGQ